jgi:hypothetical protein
MPGFATWRARGDAQAFNGAEQYSTFRKLPSQATVANTWVDLSINSGTGNPVPNYYASTPLTSATLTFNEGLYHGGAVSPDKKYVARMMASVQTGAPLPMTLTLCDYLLYYPFIDMDSTDTQTMVNSVALPRYTTGAGVQLMMVAHTTYVGSQFFTITYVNQAGVAGRVTPTQRINTAGNAYSMVTGGATAFSQGPFISLQAGDTGIQSITDITFQAGGGGLCALVLVKPLATFAVRGIDASTERDFFMETIEMPQIFDGAYLNFIACPNGSLASVPIFGDATFVWG